MNEINLTVTIDEANLILESLGNQPFVKVFELINKIQEQAERQIDGNGPSNEAAVGGTAAFPDSE